MNTGGSKFLSFRRWASILGGLLLVVCGSFYFFYVSAKAEAVENPAAQNLVNRRLAFSVRSLGMSFFQSSIVTANPDGSEQTGVPITTSLHPTEPAWSPDGTKIAFVSTQSPYDIYVINDTGSSQQTRLTNTPDIQEGNPSWSVTGKIAYHRNPQTTGGQIWVMNADGSGQIQFPGITQPFPFAPAWSPDGMKLAFVSGGEIWVINADGTNERRVTMNTSTDTDPAWSPDGSKILFAKGGSGITVINADGTNEMFLTGLSGDSQPAWSPDGTKIAFRRTATNRGIYTMDADGANQVRVLADIIQFPQCCDTSYENPAWQPLPAPLRAPFDFDGDRRSDLSVFRPAAGAWYIARPSGVPSQNFDAVQFGQNGDLPVPADYDGDGRTDVAVFRPSDGVWYLMQSTAGFRAAQFGANGDIPVPGDFDGDGKVNLAVFRPSTGYWYIARATGVPSQNFDSVPFGANGDKPIAGADFDGDAKADVCVYRPGDGNWYWLNSSNRQFVGVHFGVAEDKPVAADYDGDGRTDLAVYRPSDGVWYRINSQTNSFTATRFGISTDSPSPADYDGDGRADLAVFRPAEGIWYLLRSTQGFTGAQFGSNGDIPTPNSFVR